jgi:hypothetical protein
MKRIGYLVALVIVLGFSVSVAAQDSLADAARQNRQGKKAASAKVYTNDDFTAVPQPPAVTTTPMGTTADSTNAPASVESGPKDADADKAKTAEDKTKQAASFKSQADEQKKNIAQLEHELDIAQREYRLKVAVYYADAGNSLRDGKKFAEEDKKQKAEIDEKQKAIADAKQKLANLQDEARRAGVKVD